MQSIVNARLDVTPVDGDPKFSIPKGDIKSIRIAERAEKYIDKGKIKIISENQEYTGTKEILSGDKLELFLRLEGEASLSKVWTGLAKPKTYSRETQSKVIISLEVVDFVFGIMNWRRVYEAWESKNVSGSSDAILEDALTEYAPEIDQSLIEAVTTTTDIFSDGRTLLDVAIELADRADVFMGQSDTSLIFKEISNISPSWTATEDDITLTADAEINNEQIYNRVRVHGGKDFAIDEQNTTQDSYSTITDSTRETYQLTTRKPRIDRIEIWTKTTGTLEGVKVRIQKDSGGAPVDASDPESDIVSKKLTASFLDDDGWTTFILPKHELHTADPWLIVETDGSSGQQVAVDASGDLLLKTYFEFPLVVEDSRQSSIDTYRRRDYRKKNNNLRSRRTVIDAIQALLDRHDTPTKQFTTFASSNRAHNLNVVDAVTFDLPELVTSGDYILSEKRINMNAERNSLQLSTRLTFREAASL